MNGLSNQFHFILRMKKFLVNPINEHIIIRECYLKDIMNITQTYSNNEYRIVSFKRLMNAEHEDSEVLIDIIHDVAYTFITHHDE